MSAGAANRAMDVRVRCILAVLLCLSLGTPGGAKDEGRFDIRSAFAELEDDVFYLNGRIDYHLGKGALEALEGGGTLNFKVQIELTRKRRFMPDAEIASLRQRYRLQYHALTGRYLVHHSNSGERQSFGSLDAALKHIGRIQRVPIIDASLLDDDGRYELALRAVLDIRELPTGLRWLGIWWNDDLKIVSEWYRWPLSP
ncbi:MAG: DUF4390 domain-containing protein [Chromatiales bacterium]|nr:DUF4390 domain-containing protein [Chromatiales bacterium]